VAASAPVPALKRRKREPVPAALKVDFNAMDELQVGLSAGHEDS
jgi:hypothetical protein